MQQTTAAGLLTRAAAKGQTALEVLLTPYAAISEWLLDTRDMTSSRRVIAEAPTVQNAQSSAIDWDVEEQSAVHQAEEFNKAAELTGIILTKLDGTAKGGIVIAISAGLGVPVKLVGVGEGIDDLIDFDRAAFLEAILPPAEQMTSDSENEEEGAEQE